MYKGLVNISNKDYHADNTHLSSSSYKLLLTDIDKFYQEKILQKPRVQEENSNFSDGSYLHSLILEPESINDEYVFFPGFRKAGKEWEDFKALHDKDGKVFISKSQRKKIENWHSYYLKSEVAQSLIKGGNPEVSLFTDFRSIPTKVRADYLNSDRRYIVDVKTTSFGLSRDDFAMTMGNFYYQLSAALYLNCFEKYYEKKFDFYFIVVGKQELGCRVFKLSQKSREFGESQLAEAARIYHHCLSTNNWESSKVESVFEDEVEEV
jgi:hypothetical protein